METIEMADEEIAMSISKHRTLATIVRAGHERYFTGRLYFSLAYGS